MKPRTYIRTDLHAVLRVYLYIKKRDKWNLCSYCTCHNESLCSIYLARRLFAVMGSLFRARGFHHSIRHGELHAGTAQKFFLYNSGEVCIHLSLIRAREIRDSFFIDSKPQKPFVFNSRYFDSCSFFVAMDKTS